MPEAEKTNTTTQAVKLQPVGEKKENWLTSLKGWASAMLAKKQGAQDALKTSVPAKPAAGSALQKVSLAENGRLYDPFAWIRHVLIWTNFQVIFLAIACVVVTTLYLTVKGRGLMVIDLPDSLRERAYRSFDLKDVDRDEFDRFATSVLSTMQSFDYRNTPNVELLKGLVNPDIYTAVQNRYMANGEAIRAKGIIHDLHITAIENVYPSVNRKRYSATVKGYLNVSSFVDEKKESRFMPYRARVVVRVQPNSVINKSGYYLLQIHEFAGDESARRFDAEITAELEKKGLK